MPPNDSKLDPGRPLSPGAVALMLLLCLSWGFNQVAVKLALPDIPAMMQALFRSLGAAARASGFAPKLSVVEITGTCAHCQKAA